MTPTKLFDFLGRALMAEVFVNADVTPFIDPGLMRVGGNAPRGPNAA